MTATPPPPPPTSGPSSVPSHTDALPDPDSDSDPSVNERALFLFPAGQGAASWSVSAGAPGGPRAFDLNATFGAFKVGGGALPHVVDAPDGVASIEGVYPKGSFNPSHEPRGGFSFYAPGPSDVDLTTAKEATLAYSVYFPDGFDWVKGGKLPGLYGGDDEAKSEGCSGGIRSNSCFSVRFMWRKDGDGELYAYLPSNANNTLACDSAEWICNSEYGDSIARGSFKFEKNRRVTVAERVRLNDEDETNGELEVYVDGESKYKATGLQLRQGSAGRIRGLFMQTFFGGSNSTWATPEDVEAYFGEFSVAITEKL